MTVGTFPPGISGNGNGWRQPIGPRDDGRKKSKKKGHSPVTKRAIPGQWMIDEWTNRPGLDSVWLGLNAWNGDLNSQEAAALLEACKKIRAVGEDAFWQAYSGT